MGNRTKLALEVREISPRLAKELLATSPGNPRGIRQPGLIRKLLASMRRSEWVIGDPVKFDSEGRLLDGHHRFEALIEYGHPLPFVVIYGYDREKTEGKLDRGRMRTVAGDLAARKIANAKLVASLAQRVSLWDMGIRPPVFNRCPVLRRPTDYQVLQVATSDRTLWDIAQETPNLRRLMPRASAAFLLWLFSLRDHTHAKCFFEDLHKGEGLPAGDPALVLRNRLVSNITDRARTRALTKEELYLAWGIKAWNASVNSERITVQKLTWKPGEKFPEPI